ncbi:hypothetical protein GBA65_03225 [Rubrobacter marinus]|uniref:Oligosaccharide repeat unit polymerase n=1 Tax=Rubrobacter marinus TaxID=2653852 RepID=A0A6G8PUU5_9ACTN|nr:hypothetical protein [Rubrobacter marinus]QIN77685.1 hypothetical protein GBA65_03225 [Rubrobacter marinus]
MSGMDMLLALLLVSLTTAPVIDALRRRGVLSRPEFYLLVALYLYATGGYLTHLILPAGAPSFLLPASALSAHTSYLFSACAVLAVYAGGKLYDAGQIEIGLPPQGSRLLASLALAGCLVALAINIYYFATFGLFSGNFDRVEFIDNFDASGGVRIPYLDIFYAAVAVLALNERWPVSWLALAGLALLHLPVGNRRIVLAALIVVFVAKLLRGSRFSKGAIAAALAAVLVVGIVVGDVRGEGLSALQGLNLQRALLALSEFARPFVTLVYHVENGYEPLYGASLLQGATNSIPSFLLPFDKAPSLGRQFVQIVEGLGVFAGRVPGYGYFPVTEALVNFGPVGVPVFFLLFAWILRWLSAFAVRRGVAFVVPLLCAYMFAFGRGTFGGVVAACLWAFAAGLAIYITAGLLSGGLGRRGGLAVRTRTKAGGE